MKIIILGGAGQMGRRTIEDLVNSSGITSITIADINVQAASQMVSRLLSNSKCPLEAKYIDVFEQGQLVKEISQYDIVVSAVGPYYVFEERIVNAAIEAKIDYISICDEWDVVDRMINKYHLKAKKNGVRIICGMGASPGLTNLAAMKLASRMDNVDKIDISVWLPLDTGAGAAAIEHGIYIMSGEMAIWRNARRELIRACTEKVYKEFPGQGNQTVWNMGHPEPVTLAHNIPRVKEVNFYMGFGMMSFLLTGPSRLGWYEIPVLKKMLTSTFIHLEKVLTSNGVRSGSSRIDVWGQIDGSDEHLTAFGVSTMQESTALALSVGAQMLAQNELLNKDGGVYAPESIFDFNKCLGRLSEMGIEIYEDIELTKPFQY